MIRRLVWVGSLVGLAVWGGASESLAAEPTGEPLVISIRVYDVIGEGDKEQKKVLAEPTIATVPGRPFTMRAGGTVQPKSFGEELEVGMRVTGKLEPAADGTVRVALAIRVSQTVEQAVDGEADTEPKIEPNAETDVVKTDELVLRTVMKTGELRRFSCAGNRWCEVRVELAR
ncbi:MAG: hypothetical protein U0795_14010 [Pirellulales bacterium]